MELTLLLNASDEIRDCYEVILETGWDTVVLYYSLDWPAEIVHCDLKLFHIMMYNPDISYFEDFPFGNEILTWKSKPVYWTFDDFKHRILGEFNGDESELNEFASPICDICVNYYSPSGIKTECDIIID